MIVAGPQDFATAQSTERFQFSEVHMGTDFRITLYASDSTQAAGAASDAFERIGKLDSILSDYQADSELSRLSESAGSPEPVPVSGPLFFVLEKGLQISELTNGAFDMTAGPFVELWRIARRTGRLAGDKELQHAAELVGYELIEIDRSRQAARLKKEGMALDPGGIGKGYAADQALEVLRSHGIESALVAGGGDIVVSCPPPGEPGWEIRYSAVSGRTGELEPRTLLLADSAVSTSGDAYQFVDIDGVRYSHIIDPGTGLGVPGQNSVTVVAADGLKADAFATAFVVIGPEKAKELIGDEQFPELEFYFIRGQEDGFQSWTSDGFSRFVAGD